MFWVLTNVDALRLCLEKGRREDKKKKYISDMTFFFVWLAIEEGKAEKTERIASIQAHISHPPQLG